VVIGLASAKSVAFSRSGEPLAGKNSAIAWWQLPGPLFIAFEFDPDSDTDTDPDF
jgi:hypothetical protein